MSERFSGTLLRAAETAQYVPSNLGASDQVMDAGLSRRINTGCKGSAIGIGIDGLLLAPWQAAWELLRSSRSDVPPTNGETVWMRDLGCREACMDPHLCADIDVGCRSHRIGIAHPDGLILEESDIPPKRGAEEGNRGTHTPFPTIPCRSRAAHRPAHAWRGSRLRCIRGCDSRW